MSGAPSRSRWPAAGGLRLRLFVVSIMLVAIGLAGTQWYLSSALGRALEGNAREELSTCASMTVAALSASSAFDTARADALLRDLARRSRTRLTLVDPTGRVAADSAVSPADLPALDNHRDRPEVAEAMRTGLGRARRDSGTLHTPFLYAATRLWGPGGAWVVRAAVSPEILRQARIATWRLLAIGALLGLVAAAGMSWLAATLASRPLRGLTATARAMVRDLSVRARLRQSDEVGALAGALDELADNLAASLASLGRERDRLGAILEGMAEGVLVTGADGTIALANRAVREMFLVGRDVVGRSPIEALRNADIHEVFDEALRERATVTREVAVVGVRPRRVMARVAPVDNPDGGAVAVLSDVTELRRLETVRRDFVANVSHELRTPVAAVRAAAETLLLGALQKPDAAREFVQIVDRHGESLHRLVEDLLELSKLESREFAMQLEPLVVEPAIDHAIELMALAAGARKTRVEAAVAPGLPLVVADRRGLEHVLVNLVDNAIKYSPEGARVTLRAIARDGAVRVTVEDNGPGIEARHLPRIFERFYRVDASRSRSLGGTGLGLAIVKHMCDAMGATVSVESAAGRGTSFHVDLRAAAAG